VKLLLASLLALAALAADRPALGVPLDDPLPDCPFCGGNVELHARVVSELTSTQARIALVALDSFRK
jgi:hypothetical protein